MNWRSGVKIIPRFSLLCCFLLSSSCTEALPGRNRARELDEAVERSEKVAALIQTEAESCHLEIERSEQLLEEARQVLKEAEMVKSYCQDVNKALVREKTRKIYRVRPSVRPSQPLQVDQPKSEIKPDEKDQKPGNQHNSSEPPYSPSDAPL